MPHQSESPVTTFMDKFESEMSQEEEAQEKDTILRMKISMERVILKAQTALMYLGYNEVGQARDEVSDIIEETTAIETLAECQWS